MRILYHNKSAIRGTDNNFWDDVRKAVIEEKTETVSKGSKLL